MTRLSLILTLATIVPALLMGAGLYLRERYQREPLIYVLQSLFYGAVAAVVAIVVETVFVDLGLVFEGEEYAADMRNAAITTGEHLWRAFMGEAFPDEAAKLVLLWLLLRYNPFFQDRRDGVLYAAALGLGFALMQDFFYLSAFYESPDELVYSRLLLAVPSQVICTCLMGLFYSLFFFGVKTKRRFFRIVYVPLLAHFAYSVVHYYIFRGVNSFFGLFLLMLVMYSLAIWSYIAMHRVVSGELLRDRRDPRQIAYYYDPKNK